MKMRTIEVSYVIYSGYHATHKDSVSDILNNGFVINKKRDEEWLGFGIYFFKNKIDAVTWGNNTHYCKDNPCLLECDILIDIEKILDLDNPEKLNEVLEFFSNSMNELKKVNKSLTFRNKNHAMCYALNLFKEEMSIDLAIYTFSNRRTANAMNYKVLSQAYFYNEVQYCVSSNNTISSKKVI